MEDYCPECDMRQIPGEEEHLAECPRRNQPKMAKDATSVDDGQTVAAIIQYLFNNGPTRTKVLTKEIDGSVSFALSRLEIQGRIEKPKMGIWMLPADERWDEKPKSPTPAPVVQKKSPPGIIPKFTPLEGVLSEIDRMLFMNKFPNFDPAWPLETQQLWYNAFFDIFMGKYID